MATIIPAHSSPDLFFVAAPSVPPQRTTLIGFDVDAKASRPIYFPAIPKDAQVYILTGAGAHSYDAETGNHEPTSIGVGPRWMEV